MQTENPKNFNKGIYKTEELIVNGFEYTSQNFADYLIYRRQNTYYLVSRIDNDHLRLHFSFEA